MTVRVNFMYSGERIKLPLERGFSFAEFRALIPPWTLTLRTSSGRLLGMPWQPGKDHLSQTELAVRAVQRARPDMTASAALAAVNLVRHK